MATNQGFKNLVPDNRKLDSKFLYYWLKSKTAYLQSLGNGATFKEISKTVVERIEIPLPPVDEQQRIAAILDKADALRRKRKRALDLLDSLGQSIFQAIFGEPSEYATRWKSACALGSLAEVVSGITKGRKLNGVKVREVPYLAVANVQDKYLNLSTVKKIEASEDEIRRYRVKVDDLLLTEGGDPDKLGRGTLWQNEINEIIHQNHIFRVRLSSQEVLPLFLNWLVGGSYGKSYFLRSAKQTTGIASINKQQLSAFPVVIPPRDLQIRFVQSMDAIADVTRVASSSLDASVKLFASLQHRAFSGQL